MRDFAVLMRAPGLALIVATQLAARLPAGMYSLGVLMHVQQTQGSYTAADLLRICAAVLAGRSRITSLGNGRAHVEFDAVGGADLRVAAEMNCSERQAVGSSIHGSSSSNCRCTSRMRAVPSARSM